MRDLYDNITVTQATVPAVATATVTSSAIDLQGYNSALVLFEIGTSGDTLSGSVNWTLSLTECATSGGTYTAVAASDTSAGVNSITVALGQDATSYKLGYIGSQRFVKGVATKAGTMTNGTIIGITALKGAAAYRPVP